MLNGSSASTGISAPESFRSNWQQMLATLDNDAQQAAPSTADAGRSQTAATEDPVVSSFLSGNQPRVQTASETVEEILRPSSTEPAQSLAVSPLTFSISAQFSAQISEQEAVPEAEHEPASSKASEGVQSGHAKPSVADQPGTAKSTDLQANLLSINDAALTMTAPLFEPVQPIKIANAPVSSASPLPSESRFNTDPDTLPTTVSAIPRSASPFSSSASPISGSASPISKSALPISGSASPISSSVSLISSSASPIPAARDLVSNAVTRASRTEPSEIATAGQNIVGRSPEVPVSDIIETSASRPVIAAHAPEVHSQAPEAHSSDMTEKSPAVTPTGQISSEQATSPKSLPGEVPAELSPASVAGLGVDHEFEHGLEHGFERGVAASLSPVTYAETVRPQAAVTPAAATRTVATRTTSGSESARVNHAGDSQPNSAAAPAIHLQTNAPAPGPTGAAAAVTSAATVVVRDPASILPSNPGTGLVAETAARASTAETFTALDGASSQVHATWTHAGANQAEAGFQDPELGWVSVRAGVNSGGISAVVVPGSPDATEALGAHMAGLHDYLAEQHSPVDTLTLASGGKFRSDASLGQDTQKQETQNQGTQHQGMQDQGTQNGGTQNQGQHQSPQDNPANAQALNSVPASSALVESTQLGGTDNPAILAGSGARYISVMA